MSITLLKDLDISSIKFKPIRKTDTGSRIIDVENQDLYQTPWLRVLYDVDYNICVDCEKISNILQTIDNKVIEQSVANLDFNEKDIIDMYKPLKKNYLSIPINTGTILFDRCRNFYDKPEIKDKIKANDYVRCIFNFKKIYYKDHEITFPIEVLQIESA